MKIVVMEPLSVKMEQINALAAPLQAAGHDFVYYTEKETDQTKLLARVQDADVIMLANQPLSAEIINACPNLKMLSVAFTGVDHIALAACRERGILVCNAAGYSTNAVAELTFGLAISVIRNIVPCDARCRQAGTKDGLVGFELFGKTFGVVGTGAIGSRVAKIAAAFGLLPEAEQQMYFRRLGQWYAQQREYEEALDWLYRGHDFDGLLAAVQQLRDWSMRPQHRQHLFDWLRECPPEILWQYPQAVLIIMRRMFSLNMVPEMLQVKEWYVTALERNTALSQRERDNYYGELEVILSFLAFNSITGMSEHHRRAYKLLSGAPQTLSKQGIWTFGAPSVLGLYLRTGCSLRQTVEDMQECMPPYYLLSGWHGAGAAELTEAEASLLQGRIDEMDMPLQKAYYQAEKHGQECITICCDFLEMQRDLFRGVYSSKAEAYSRHQWQLQPWKQSMLLNTADMCAGFYYALLGKPEYIPSWLTDGNGQQPSVLYPARPCRNYISAQCLLAKGQYTELLVRWSDWEQECRPYSNFLCLLYLQVQRAAAFAGRGDVTSCRASLKQALAMAEADKLVLPLAQNIALLRPYLEQELQGEFSAAAAAALHLGQQLEAGRGQIMSASFAEAGLQELTEQELQIAQLAAARHTNREIAQRLSLSEGTIKQYLNKIFAKLQIDAAAKNKRHQLERFFSNS